MFRSSSDSSVPVKKCRFKHELISFSFDITSCLIHAQSSSLLTDSKICFLGKTFAFHKAIVAQQSYLLQSLFQAPGESLTVSDDIGCSEEHYVSLMLFFYAQPLVLSRSNALYFFELSRVFDCPQLRLVAKEVCLNGVTQKCSLTVSYILEKMSNDNHKDLTVVYKSKSIDIHHFFVASLFGYFNNVLLSNERTCDFTNDFVVDEECFEEFFKSVYSGQIVFSTEKFYDWFTLSSFFQVNELVELCTGIELSNEALCFALLKANSAKDLTFIDKFSPRLVSITVFDDIEPLILPPNAFNYLSKDVPISWLIKALVTSFTNFHDKSLWTLDTLRSCLLQFKDSILGNNERASLVLSLMRHCFEDEHVQSVFFEFSCIHLLPLLSADYGTLLSRYKQLEEDHYQLQLERNKLAATLNERENLLKKLRAFSVGDRVTVSKKAKSQWRPFSTYFKEIGVVVEVSLRAKTAVVDFPSQSGVNLPLSDLYIEEFAEVCC
ncbi:hypothetical protein RCL1_004488 [Eukaryota sp. TZLM3-RCL]